MSLNTRMKKSEATHLNILWQKLIRFPQQNWNLLLNEWPSISWKKSNFIHTWMSNNLPVLRRIYIKILQKPLKHLIQCLSPKAPCNSWNSFEITLDSNREISARSRSLSLSNDLILLASLISMSLSVFISSNWRLLTSFCACKLFSNSWIQNTLFARDDSSSCTWKQSAKKDF